MNMNKPYRQKVINSYLNDSGYNKFEANEFLNFIIENPDWNKDVYKLFFPSGDKDLNEHGYQKDAWENKKLKARQFTHGLTIQVEKPTIIKGDTVAKIYTYPKLISPVEDRKSGGGYVVVDPNDLEHQHEMGRQAINYLKNFKKKYGSYCEDINVSLFDFDTFLDELTSKSGHSLKQKDVI